MPSVYFEEVQRLREKPWFILLITVTAFSSIIPLAKGVYTQIILGRPWGNKPMSDDGLITLTLFVTIIALGLCWLMFNLRLETRVDESGIWYKMFPVRSRWRLITPAEIKVYSFESRYKLFESGGIGYHRNLLKNSTSLRMWGGKHITISLHNGHRLLIGTANLEGLEWAMRRLIHKTSVH